MNPTWEKAISELKSTLEERAEAISSTVQMLVERIPLEESLRPCERDLLRMHDAAVELFRMARERLSQNRFRRATDDPASRLQEVRHDLRGILNNLVGRSQLILEEPDLRPTDRAEVETICRHTKACTEALNAHREHHAVPPPDLQLHEGLLDGTVGLPEEIAPGELGTSHPALPARILVADDSEASREVLGRFLSGRGHAVDYATNGNEAIVALTQGEFDLVLLDLVMPEKNGFEVLNWMRQSGQLSHTPVIIISGMDSDANAIRGIEMGAEDFLGRPIDLKLLRARVDACLERQRLREKEFAQYFTPDLARHLVRHPQELRTGRQIEVSVLFCDIVGFSRVSERLGPEATLKWLSQVLGVMSACVMDEEGVLVDYTGDQIMALWGAPKDQPDHASRACRSALAMLASLPALDAAWRSVIRDFTEVSIGISTGEAYVGNVGTERKFKYGALGNTVNLGSRVQGATKYVRAKALLTADTWQRLPAGSGVLGRRLGKTRVNNILEPVELYELAEPGQPGWDTLRAGYERALACFESGGWQEAATCLTELLREHPGDGPSLILLSRAVEQMLQNGSTPKSFDPVWSLPGK